ncbi:hypothetical protein K1T71_006772 [Dendrolimus kikuchii]|uniref:Uncharacterized protein n=1 Tax=Dendrolimus kikuchii TaxID=765133 RepID=A0ACC1D1R0_9NEOP|nr:hypothetical protein K1T71_006772 [Dendrolimus kikuchii]
MCRLIINCFILVLVFNFVQRSTGKSASDPPINTPEEPSKLAQCKIKASDLKALQNGEKGDKGSAGPKGPTGVLGPVGPPGNDGMQGPKGERGDTGERGNPGNQGLQGPPGISGEPGAQGSPGEKGPQGHKGDSTLCTYPPEDPDFDVDGKLGSKDKPLTNVCKSEGKIPPAPSHFIKSKGIDLIEIHCEGEDKETCLLPKYFKTEFDIKDGGLFWLSDEPQWNTKNIYGLTTDQLQWLQQHSTFIKQTIRYHCLNSVPINDDDSKSIKLLTWNDVIIGNKPSSTTPVYYKVINDGCKDSASNKDVWKYTEIEITSPVSYRLPIIDILIHGVKGEVQKKSTGESSPDVTIDKPEELSPLAQCKLKSSDPKYLEIDEKGLQGDAGSPGPQGDPGLEGLRGSNGKDGSQGLKGDNGDKGLIGEAGKEGDRGAKGAPGPDGSKGILGPRGPRGDPGIAVYEVDDISGEHEDVERGSEKKPLENVCKYEGKVPKADKHYIKSPYGSKLWEVLCETDNSETCILPKAPVTIVKKSDKPFWLSEDANGSLQNIYGVPIDQLQWLQRRSAFIKQTIRYYCLNSVPIHDDESKNLKLLTWNNVVIGDKPSETTPFYYEVIKDQCKDSAGKKDEEKYTEIVIRSSKVNRLPILDFLINDVNGKEEKYKIEHVKLCFV